MAWIGLSSKRAMSCSRAASRSREARISSMIASRCSSAVSRPSRMCARRLLLGQLVLGAAHDHLALVGHVVVDHRPQVQRARHVVDERDHVHAERGLHRRVLVELVEHDLGDHVALELDHEAHAALVGVDRAGRRSRGCVCRVTSSAIFSIRPPSPPFLTMNGSSVTTIASLPCFSGSMWARAWMRTRPAAGLVGVADALHGRG